MSVDEQDLSQWLEKGIAGIEELLKPASHESKFLDLQSKLMRLKRESETGSINSLQEHFSRMIALLPGKESATFPEINHPHPEINAVLNTYRNRLSDLEDGFVVRFDYHLAARLLIAGWDFTRAKNIIAQVNAKGQSGKATDYLFYAERVIKTVYKNPQVRTAMKTMAYWKQDKGFAQSETNLKKLKISLYR